MTLPEFRLKGAAIKQTPNSHEHYERLALLDHKAIIVCTKEMFYLRSGRTLIGKRDMEQLYNQ
jgi:hypothetical protein